MKRITITDVLICTVMLLLVAFTLAPAVARLQRTPEDAKCQSNMKRWAEAMALYVVDNHGTYPTNRIYSNIISSEIPITQDGLTNADGTPLRFKYGLNWVEALYPYIQNRAKQTGQDWKTFRKCPNASNTTYPLNNTTAVMSYAFNFNMAEKIDSVMRNPEKLMMLRELDRLMNAVLRPSNDSSAGANVLPMSPFLDTKDESIPVLNQRPSNPNLHGNGSYIVFADGHVHYFTTDYFPNQDNFSTGICWDKVAKQWYNYIYDYPVDDTQRLHSRSIAITP